VLCDAHPGPLSQVETCWWTSHDARVVGHDAESPMRLSVQVWLLWLTLVTDNMAWGILAFSQKNCFCAWLGIRLLTTAI